MFTEVLTGSAGPTIATVGLFVVYWLTTRRDRRSEEDRRRYEEQLAKEAALDQAVARVLRTAVMLPKDIYLAPLGPRLQVFEMFDACQHLVAQVQTRDPAMARWLVERHGELQTAGRQYWWWAAIPGLRRRRARRWALAIEALIAGLHHWKATGQTPSRPASTTSAGRK